MHAHEDVIEEFRKRFVTPNKTRMKFNPVKKNISIVNEKLLILNGSTTAAVRRDVQRMQIRALYSVP